MKTYCCHTDATVLQTKIVKFTFGWNEQNKPCPFKLASHIASEAAYGDPPNGLDRIQSAAYQKDRARRLVFQKWEREYYLDRTIETFRECWCDTPPSAAYSYTITTHPSETHHPLWKEASKTKVEEDELGRKVTLPLYHRRTTSAAF